MSILSAFLFFSIAASAEIKPTPALNKDIRQSVVAIKANGSVIGSGYLQSTDNWIYVVTAKHVVEPMLDATVEVLVHLDDQTCSFNFELPRRAVEHSIFISTHDVAALRLGKFYGNRTAIFPPNVKPKSPCNKVPVTPMNIFVRSDDVEPTEQVIVAGYPSSLNHYLEPAMQFYDDMEPLFRRGMIAGKNQKRGVILVDTSVMPGNSGGPVFVRREEISSWQVLLLGIATDYVPAISMSKNERGIVTNVNVQNAAYTVVLPSEKIGELLRTADTLD